jgi:hypothetical protein
MNLRTRIFTALPLTALALAACGGKPPPPTARDQLTRGEFNQLAERQNLPLFWVEDANGNRAVDADEVATLLFQAPFAGTLDDAYRRLVAAKAEPAPDASQPEGRRRALVRQDLAQGRVTLLRSDLTALPPAEKAFMREMLQASEGINALFALQTGAAALAPRLPADPESHALFRRDWGPLCMGATTEDNPECTAIPGAPKPLVDVYPASIDGIAQDAPGFCALLQKPGRSAALLDPFTVVREHAGTLEAVPFASAYAAPMGAIAANLDAAAAALKDTGETALVAYLQAAAQGFRSNDWWPADEAWSRMSADNSKWFLRVGPDEVYWDPCGTKAGFHLTLARINEGSRQWQARLEPVQQDMETAIARAAGPPYRARRVGFDLPEFIDIVTNAGEARRPFGGTIGQSLPNVGPVARESRGRTVAMVNLYTDADSMAVRRASAESLLDTSSMANVVDDDEPENFLTILHEATHNLGPAQEYAVRGQSLRKLLGGPLDTLMEELKAQTGALFLIDTLRTRGVIDDTLARRAYANGVAWALGHISVGMYAEPGHQRRTYSQLAAIQIGYLMDQGALDWDPQALAANGTDRGAFHLHEDRIVSAVDSMMKLVAGLKARGDRKGAEALAAKYVDGPTVPHTLIRERYARQTRGTLVYSVTL